MGKLLLGYGTYLAAFGSIAFGLIGWLIGALDEAEAGKYIFVGLTAAGLRRAITNK